MAHTEPGKPGKYAIFTKSQGKPRVVREFSMIFISVRKNKLFSLQIAFINSCMVVRKVVVPFVVIEFELYHST